MRSHSSTGRGGAVGVCLALACLGSAVAPGGTSLAGNEGPAPGRGVAGAGQVWPAPRRATLPLSFTPNAGQVDGQARFISQGNGYVLFLTATALVLVQSSPQPAARPALGGGRPRAPQGDARVWRLRLAGANPVVRLVGLDRQSGRANYLTGQDRRRWRVNLPTYGQVAYRNLYPGLDLLVSGDEGQVQYHLVGARGASACAATLVVEEGLLSRWPASAGSLLSGRPGTAGAGRRGLGWGRGRDGRAICPTSGRLPTVAVAEATSGAPGTGVSSQTVRYATYLGGRGPDAGNAIAVDAAGNAYVTGRTGSTDFPLLRPLHGSYRASAAGTDAFVAKLSPTGTLLYSTYLGTTGGAVGQAIAVDDRGNAYVVGQGDIATTSTRLPRSRYGGNVFAAKLNAQGNTLIYGARFGGPGDAAANAVAVDHAGHAYITGSFYNGSRLDPGEFLRTTPHAFQRTCDCSNMTGSFVVKLSATADRFVYSTYLSPHGSIDSRGIAVDAVGNAYVTGSGFIAATPGAAQMTSTVGTAFAAKLNASGSALLYATYIGGSQGGSLTTAGSGIAVDAAGNAYVTGRTDTTDFPTTPHAFQPKRNGRDTGDAFVTKVSPTGHSFVYSTYLGGNRADEGRAIAVDAAGHAYVTGRTLSADFPTTAGALRRTLSGYDDAFVAELDPTGRSLLSSTYLGGGGQDRGSGIAVDSRGTIYVTGNTTSRDFPTVAAQQAIYGGDPQKDGPFGDAFVVALPAPRH